MSTMHVADVAPTIGLTVTVQLPTGRAEITRCATDLWVIVGQGSVLGHLGPEALLDVV